jgi:septal ring factor EnvC (AmiA/AmiB activator)
MDNTIRQLQQSNNNNMIPYQQTILHYQMQMRQLTDENNRLMQQLHVYSTMPASINELKQQHNILNEQLRQITMRNSYLEKEIADGQQATKHAAEIYKKS